MMDALIVTWDGGGNLPPALGIARELVRRGARVRVLGHRIQEDAVRAAGLEFHPIREGRDYVSAEPRGTVDGALGLVALFADRGIAADARALLADDPADVIMVDCLLWGAIDDLAGAETPVVSLVHSISDYFDRNAAGPIGLLARLRGVDAVAAGRRADLTLVTTRPEFESSRGGHPGAVHSGFIWQERPVEAVAGARATVLVSFSTTAFPGQRRVLQRTLDALADEPVDVIATTGAVDPADLRAPANARVVRRLDHSEILPGASAVVGHGGHATTARALGAGVPVLVLPMHPLMDQPSVGRAVARLGVGATLPKGASARRIRAAVRRLLSDDRVRDAARRLGEDVRSRDGALAAADAIEAVANG
jgi:UDP:flavonoid glycosyltransferase YjiC (YdhE family)